ncbi:MAG: ribosome recycling factor family protein [Colwellia sp.]|nr:ribosome recycling factor family protein [Colwellia sp.]
MSKQAIITLPSFLRRVMKAYAIKTHIRALGGDLHRIGRSRNWQLKIDRHKIMEIVLLIESSDEQSWLWLAKLLRQQNEHLTFEGVLDIARRNSGITINELVFKTDCTIVEARKVIDQLEGLND